MNPRLLIVTPLALLLSSGCDGAKPPNRDSFADRPVDSYATYTGTNGQKVQPRWGDLKPDDFGSRPVVFNSNGLHALRPVPADGVHPRILFGPDDLPDIRRNLKETHCGREVWKNLISWTEMAKGRYDGNADYAKPDVHQGSHGGLHARVPLFRLGVPRTTGSAYDRSSNAAAIYASLVSGTATNCPDYYWSVFPLEAFRCLVEKDDAAARVLARAVTTALGLAQKQRDKERAALQARKPGEPLPPPAHPILGLTSGLQFAFTYDLVFPWLDAAQRRAWHDELAATTWSHDNYGTFNDAHGSRSNWASFSYWLFQTLAIEGEAGFNELKVRGIYRGWRNLLTYGWYPSGANYEGEAKNQLGMDGILALSRRNARYGWSDLAAHPHLRAYGTNFLPHSVNPMLTGFHQYDLLGGSRIRGGGQLLLDTLGLKVVYPDDPVVDWVYRRAVGERYENVPTRPDGYYNSLLFFAVFARDFTTPPAAPATLGSTFLCGERALLMTRSSWDTNALMLNLHVRQANGGHPFPDRNALMLAGAGRVWSPNGYASFTSAENSVVVIDGKTQTEYSPGRMVDFTDSADATFAVGDAAYAWRWDWKTLDIPRGAITASAVRAGAVKPPAGWEFEPHTFQDFAFTKPPFEYLKTPLSEAPHWIQPAGFVRPLLRKANTPVQHAWRTAGIVRGPHPYAVVIDDIRVDDTPHAYDWTLTLEYDVQIASIKESSPGITDILLTGSDPDQSQDRPASPLPGTLENAATPAGQPMLLVRVLNGPGASGPKPQVVQFPNANNAKKYEPVRRLVIPVTSVAPQFKVLLYPHRQGDPLPASQWNAARTAATVSFAGQSDELDFTPGASGKTHITVRRDGATLLSLNHDIPPLN